MTVAELSTALSSRARAREVVRWLWHEPMLPRELPDTIAGQRGAAEGHGVDRRQGPSSQAARDPRAYTPKHLADKILQSKSTLEGERKQVTVLFADVKG